MECVRKYHPHVVIRKYVQIHAIHRDCVTGYSLGNVSRNTFQRECIRNFLTSEFCVFFGLTCHNSYALEQEGPKSIPVFVPPKLQVSSERRFTPISKWGQSMSTNCRSLPMQRLPSGRPPVNKPHCSVYFTFIFYFKKLVDLPAQLAVDPLGLLDFVLCVFGTQAV